MSPIKAAVEVKMNPTFKAEVEEKFEKQALEALQRGESLNNQVLTHLSRKGLIEVSDVTNLSTPPGQRELLFTGITDNGRRVLES